MEIEEKKTHAAALCMCMIRDRPAEVSGGARGPPACSGNHRMGSAGPRPREARTTPRPCCLPHLQRGRGVAMRTHSAASAVF